MKYTVDITDAALQDMDEIYDYIFFTFLRSGLRTQLRRSMTASRMKSSHWKKCRFVLASRNLSHAFRRSSIGCL